MEEGYTIFERIVKVCMRERFLNSPQQEEAAAKILVSESTGIATKLVSPFWPEVRLRNYQVCTEILKKDSIDDAKDIVNDEYFYLGMRPKDYGRRYFRLYLRRMTPFLDSIGVRHE
ncbi:hypothetical protein KY311_02040 [Candidatus Woesearchaeota archaeon]|nr:hypothetical protein [Candidatus Woesearchaeota archaeon]